MVAVASSPFYDVALDQIVVAVHNDWVNAWMALSSQIAEAVAKVETHMAEQAALNEMESPSSPSFDPLSLIPLILPPAGELLGGSSRVDDAIEVDDNDNDNNDTLQ